MDGKISELEARITALEKRVAESDEKSQSLQQALLTKICMNSVMKEEYNFKLLSFLLDKMGLKNTESEHELTR
ncbi:MAG: hypothetical protein PHG07_08000 [Lachnospiraceae bacterium]|nr:hypothetical protein [Lachnospiraceae bacterium]